MVKLVQPLPDTFQGRGIVTCGGGYRYFTNAWVLIRMLRHLGCQLPIQLWYLGPKELDDGMRRIVDDYGVECIDGLSYMRSADGSYCGNALLKRGWILKSIAIARCGFQEVIFLDSDNLPLRDPAFLFETPQYRAKGALFWPDVSTMAADRPLWRIFRVPYREEPEFESGQIVVNKQIHSEALALTASINLRADLFYRFMYGDKDTFRFAWHRLDRPFAMPRYPPQGLCIPGGGRLPMLCQHDFQGNRLFQHRNMYKWDLFGENPWVPGYFFEHQCRAFLDELRSRWDGRCGKRKSAPKTTQSVECRRTLLGGVWFLDRPPASPNGSVKNRGRKTTPANGSPTASKLSQPGQSCCELKFEPNGTVVTGPGAKGRPTPRFWSLETSTEGNQLLLSHENGMRIRLRQRNSTYWEGHHLGAKAAKTKVRMRSLHDIYPHLKTKPGMRSISSNADEIRRYFKGDVHLINSAHGIGDHICAVYACTALARCGVPVTFHTRFAAWLARVSEPGLTITKEPYAHPSHDLQYDYGNELRYGLSKASWYAGGLHPLLSVAKPQVDRTHKVSRFPFNNYVLLAPFAAWKTRDWPATHWMRLATLLCDAGYEVVAIGGRRDLKRLKGVFGKTHAYWVVGHEPEWVVDAMLGAAAYVGVDSGMTHLAALLGIKSVAIHAILSASFLWPRGAVTSVAPDTRCVFCRWQKERGYVGSCDAGCSALASVGPESVFDALMKTV